MAVLFGEPTWLPALADRLAARVAAVTGLARDRVFEYAGDPCDLVAPAGPVGERFAAVWFDRMTPEGPAVAGGGVHGAWDVAARVDVFSRLATDREFQSARQLRDRTAGMAELVRLAAKAVHLWGAEENGVSTLVQPTRISPAGIDWAAHRKLPAGWAAARVAVAVRVVPDLT